MIAVKSSYLRDAIIQHTLGIPAYVHAGYSVYLALYTDDPTIDDTGTEVTGGSYARQALSFGAASGGAIVTDTATTYNDMPATTVTHWGIRDASSGGNLLYFGAFDLPIELNANDVLSIDAGNITVGEV